MNVKKIMGLLLAVVIAVIIGVDNVNAETISVINSNIVAAYTYDASTCPTGNESTCVETDCYTTESENSCPAGTFIKYNVNDTTTKYFNVLADSGKTIKMQQRENTVDGVVWGNSVLGGPTTALAALESATSSWSNVNDQTYALGTTVFYSNSYTGCPYESSVCTTNAYSLGERTSKARMVSFQDLLQSGCSFIYISAINQATRSCPAWVTTSDYWTTSVKTASSSLPLTYPWSVKSSSSSAVYFENSSSTSGVRAVVEVDKYVEKEVANNAEVKVESNTSKVYISGKASELSNYKKLVVKEYLKETDVYKRLQNIFRNKENIIAYDLSLYDFNDKVVQPSSKVKVNIQLSSDIDQSKLKLWYIMDDFTQQELLYKIDNNILSFETDHFSIYALTIDSDAQVVEVEDTALNSSILVLIIGTIVIIIGMIILIKLYSKKSKRNQ